MSAALAVIGVTAFVCLTLRKRGLMPKGMTREQGAQGGRDGRDGGKGSLQPSELAYGAAARTTHEQAKPLF